MSDFIHLHVHTDFSFFDGCTKISDLIAQTKKLGMPAVAMTDHGNMCGAIDFYFAAKKLGIKPIIGLEAYYINDYKMGEKSKCEYKDNILKTHPSTFTLEDYPKYQIHHKTLLAQNYEGFLNLVRLTSESYLRGLFKKPCIDFDTLAKYSKGIISLSGCLNGVVSQYLLYSDYEKARQITANFVDIFGRDRYFIEIQNHHLPEEKKIIPLLVKLAKDLNLKLVATNDVHYISKEDSLAHDAMICIHTNSKVNDKSRLRYPNNEFYLKSREEMGTLFSEFPEALDNTLLVSDMCELKIENEENFYPKFKFLEQIANIVRFNKFSAKQIFKDVARVNDVPYERIDKITKSIPSSSKITLDTFYKVSKEFRSEINRDEKLNLVFKEAKYLEGMISGIGKPDDNIITCNQSVNTHLPIMTHNGIIYTQFSKEGLEKLEFLCKDFSKKPSM